MIDDTRTVTADKIGRRSVRRFDGEIARMQIALRAAEYQARICDDPAQQSDLEARVEELCSEVSQIDELTERFWATAVQAARERQSEADAG